MNSSAYKLLSPVLQRSSVFLKEFSSSFKEFWYFFSQNRGAVIGLILIAIFALIALLADLIAPHDPTHLYLDHIKVFPVWIDGNWQFILGTDDIGRDLLSRLIYGARVSLTVGFFVVCFSAILGSSLGLISGYSGGFIDKVIMRFTDILMAWPSVLLAIIVVSLLGPSLINAILAVGVVSIPGFIRIARASVLAEKNKQYVTAVKSFGSSHFRVLILNILPNCIAPIIVQAALGFSDGILNVAALGFLGFGAQPPTPEWGTMLSNARSFIETASYLVTLPGLCILTVVLAFNLFGDGLRDAFDPKLKK